MCASRGWGTLAPCPCPAPSGQGAWVMRTTHELPQWVNPPTPLGVEGDWVNSEWQVFRWLQHVISTTLDCALFKVAHVDCCHEVGLLLVLVLLTTNVTEYRRFDLHAAHGPFILVLGLLYPFTYLARIVTGWLLFRLTIEVGALRDDARHAKQTSVLSNLERPVVHILIAGVLCMTAIMILWNWLITPLYMKVPRDVVVKMLIPTFLPFNLVKGGINASLAMLLYKPVVTALRRAHLVPESSSGARHAKMGVVIVSVVLLISFVLLALVLAKVI